MQKSLSVLLLALVLAVVAAQAAPAESIDKSQVTREEIIAKRLLERINDFRRQKSLPPFTSDGALARAAATQSRDMIDYDFFDHTSPVPGRAKPWDRAAAAGYPSRTIAENLFMCMGTDDSGIPQQCFDSWATSSGHRENLLDTTRTQIGIGVASNAQDETYITAVFGRP